MTTTDDQAPQPQPQQDAAEKPTWTMPPLPNPRGGGYFVPGQLWSPVGGQSAAPAAAGAPAEVAEPDDDELDEEPTPKKKRGKAIAGGSLLLLILGMAAMSAAGGPAALVAAVAGGGAATGAAVGGGATAAGAATAAYLRRRKRTDRPGRTSRQPSDAKNASEKADAGRAGRAQRQSGIFGNALRRALTGSPGTGRSSGAGGARPGGAGRRPGGGAAKGALARALRSAAPKLTPNAAPKAAPKVAPKAGPNRTPRLPKRPGGGGGGLGLSRLFGGGGRGSSGSASKRASNTGRKGPGLLSRLTGRDRSAAPRGTGSAATGRQTARQRYQTRRDARRQQGDVRRQARGQRRDGLREARLARRDAKRQARRERRTQRWTQRKDVLAALTGAPQRAQRRQQRRQVVADRRQDRRQQRWGRRDQRRDVRWARRDAKRVARHDKRAAFWSRQAIKLARHRVKARRGMSARMRRIAGYRPNWYARLKALHPGSSAPKVAFRAFWGKAFGAFMSTIKQIPGWMWAQDPAPAPKPAPKAAPNQPKHQAPPAQPPQHRPAVGKVPVSQIVSQPKIVPPMVHRPARPAAPVPPPTPVRTVPSPINQQRKKPVVTATGSSGRGLHRDIDAAITTIEDELGSYEMVSTEDHHNFLGALQDVPAALGEAFSRIATHFESDTPVDQEVSELLREMASACDAAGTTANELFDRWSTDHEYDINRALDPRPGEELLDVNRTY